MDVDLVLCRLIELRVGRFMGDRLVVCWLLGDASVGHWLLVLCMRISVLCHASVVCPSIDRSTCW